MFYFLFLYKCISLFLLLLFCSGVVPRCKTQTLYSYIYIYIYICIYVYIIVNDIYIYIYIICNVVTVRSCLQSMMCCTMLRHLTRHCCLLVCFMQRLWRGALPSGPDPCPITVSQRSAAIPDATTTYSLNRLFVRVRILFLC